MNKIFCLMGKSASGKDTVYKNIINDETLGLSKIVPYTTRPIRDGEEEGVQYHFTNEVKYNDFDQRGVIIESRLYHTVHGDWRYFTVDDGNIDLQNKSYIVIGTLEVYESFKNYYKEDSVVPILIEVDPGERLSRALNRERMPENQKYAEMCRRFLSDEEDFSEDKIERAQIPDNLRFDNSNLDECVKNIKELIVKQNNS